MTEGDNLPEVSGSVRRPIWFY